VTVAAVILAPGADAALAEIEGEAAIRRPVRAAWAGGALPTIHVVPEPERVAAVVADLNVVVVGPPAAERGAAWFVHGLRAARETIAEADAALLWPFAYGWVDPETVTSLIEAHGVDPAAIVRPAFHGEPGYPILVPAAEEPRLAELFGVHGEEAISRLVSEGTAYRQIELGDPGIVHDISTPRAELPPFEGPAEPAGRQDR
jgi:CTP:molybdopterin cytidylyltransferase MocA